jgi:hypothetical protein
VISCGTIRTHRKAVRLRPPLPPRARRVNCQDSLPTEYIQIATTVKSVLRGLSRCAPVLCHRKLEVGSESTAQDCLELAVTGIVLEKMKQQKSRIGCRRPERRARYCGRLWRATPWHGANPHACLYTRIPNLGNNIFKSV